MNVWNPSSRHTSNNPRFNKYNYKPRYACLDRSSIKCELIHNCKGVIEGYIVWFMIKHTISSNCIDEKTRFRSSIRTTRGDSTHKGTLKFRSNYTTKRYQQLQHKNKERERALLHQPERSLQHNNWRRA